MAAAGRAVNWRTMSGTGRSITVAAIVTALLAAAPWTAGANPQSPAPQRHKMIHAGQSENGQQVTLEVAQVLEIALDENRTTGFEWVLKPAAEAACTLILNEPATAAGPPGKGGTHRWQFQGARPGAEEIELEYRRPWEKDQPPGRTFKLRVLVR